ncbi:FhuE receptor precursor [compost metagenome]
MKDKDTNKDVRTFVPEQTFNILTSYTLPQLPQLKVGASMTWQSSTSQSATSNLIQDSYALINLMANYDVNDHFSIQANAKNITNEKYFNSLEYGQTYYGAPANYNVALKFKY